MKKLDQIRRVRHLSGIVQAHLKLPLLRIGLRTGLFDELRSPLTASEVAERLELAPDLVASWLRALHAHHLVRCEEERYQIGSLVRWLLDADEAPAIRAILDQAALTSGQDRESLLITDTLFPNQVPGVDLDGWAIFTVSGNGLLVGQFLVGVHMESGDTKDWEDEDQ